MKSGIFGMVHCKQIPLPRFFPNWSVNLLLLHAFRQLWSSLEGPSMNHFKDIKKKIIYTFIYILFMLQF